MTREDYDVVVRVLLGVSDGIRTRDHLDHNQVLYQLSYTHHAAPVGAGAREEV
jgi:hypothetical protein